MNILNYLTDQAGLMILGLIVISIFLYRKYKTQRYFKYIEKQQKEKDSKNL